MGIQHEPHASATLFKRRVIAIGIGMAMGILLLSTMAIWQATYVHGNERCAICNGIRTADRRLVWRYWSEARGVIQANAESCRVHEWVPTGCWIEGFGSSFYEPPNKAAAHLLE